MDKKKLLELLGGVSNVESPPRNKHEKVLVIDALNLFMRNFAMINTHNKDGNHVGGTAGFLRSLGSLIRITQPTTVYVVFDGLGSSTNRKNLLPEYKSGRNINRVTNWDSFNNVEEENTSKINQVVRLIHYLKCLPITVISLEKVEADDIIAYYSDYLSNTYDSTVIIVSNDKDYLQLINRNIIVYRPTEREFYNIDHVKAKFKIHPDNFIIYKTLMGDGSDKVKGVKGLGEKGLYKYFPEISTRKLTLDDVFKICEEKYKTHIIYTRILFDKDNFLRNYKIMDLHNPLVDDNEKEYLREVAESSNPLLNAKDFEEMYRNDGLGDMIRNIPMWLDENFRDLQ